jgi:hypothetical protein
MLTRKKIEQFVKQGKAAEKLLKSTGKKSKMDSLLAKQLKQTKKILNKINS